MYIKIYYTAKFSRFKRNGLYARYILTHFSNFRFGKRSGGTMYAKSPVDNMMYYPVSINFFCKKSNENFSKWNFYFQGYEQLYE